MFINGPGDQISIPDWVIPKTQKMVFDYNLLSTQHYKVRIKGIMLSKNQGIMLSGIKYHFLSLWYDSHSTMVTNFTLLFLSNANDLHTWFQVFLSNINNSQTDIFDHDRYYLSWLVNQGAMAMKRWLYTPQVSKVGASPPDTI